MNAIDSNRMFGNPDREWSALYMRAYLRELLEAEKKDHDAIKLIYGIILEEEQQDLARRKVEIAERQDHREATQAVQQVSKPALPPAEVKRKVRILLGKECQ
jgi:hypothetical protein